MRHRRLRLFTVQTDLRAAKLVLRSVYLPPEKLVQRGESGEDDRTVPAQKQDTIEENVTS